MTLGVSYNPYSSSYQVNNKKNNNPVTQHVPNQGKKNLAPAALAAAAITAVGIAALIITKNKNAAKVAEKAVQKVKPAHIQKQESLARALVDETLRTQNIKSMQKQINAVQRRISPKAAEKKAAELAEVFGTTVEHVVQKSHIVG